MMSSDRYYIGVDTGGTFTDCAVVDQRGTLVALTKSSTTPADPSQGVVNALSLAAEKLQLPRKTLLERCAGFVHGSTIATNAMLERKGAATVLVTTKGHEDSILIGRVYQKRAGLSERQIIHESRSMKAHPPLVARERIRGVTERVDYRGRVVVALDETAVSDLIGELQRRKVEAVAVCLLWSFLNADHEQRIKELILARCPGMFVVTSSDIAPLIGEYERTVTTVLSAYLGPRVSGYLKQLARALESEGASDIFLMHNNGGVTTLDAALVDPILLLDSGPTGGTLGAQLFSRMYELPNLICIDMGGTSLDVSLIINGEFLLEQTPVIHQHTFLTPKVKVESVGAGGGSLAWIDAGGILKVGPQSAGAVPGPACYDRDGREATVTDANLVLGYLNPDYFVGGRIHLSTERARAAVEQIATRMNMSPIEAASGMLRIVNSHMADLIHRVTIENGIDPRQFVLLSFGGAGGAHAAFIAKELGIEKVCIPAAASVFAALGMSLADLAHSAETSTFFRFPLSDDALASINEIYEHLAVKLEKQFRDERVELSRVTWTRVMYLKYGLQVHEVAITIPSRELRSDDQSMLRELFETRYEEIFGSGSGYRDAGVEAVKYRLEGRYRRVDSRFAAIAAADGGDAGPAMRRRAYFDGAAVDTDIYDWARLRPGHRINGPAIVEREGDTIVIPPFAKAEIDPFYNMWLSIE